MKHYDTVILGSGFFSFGYALSHENVLILEETQLADRAFGGCLRGFSRRRRAALSPQARELEEFLLREKILAGDGVDIPALEVGFCAYLRGKKPVDILLGTLCVSAEKVGDGWQVVAVNNEGLCHFSAATLIDARVPEGKRLNVLVKAPGGLPCLPESADFTVDARPAFRENEYLLRFRFAEIAEINRAKSVLILLLEALPESAGLRILASSYRMFADEPLSPCRTAEGGFRIDETAFGDCLDAFTKGGEGLAAFRT